MFPTRTQAIWIFTSFTILFANQISASCPRCVKIEEERAQEQKKNPYTHHYYEDQVNIKSEKENSIATEKTPKFSFVNHIQGQEPDMLYLAQAPLSSEKSSQSTYAMKTQNTFFDDDKKGAKNHTNPASKQNESTFSDVQISSFSTLFNVLKTKDLLETLDGSFTLFIPTDEALQALPPGTLEKLLKPENKEMLAILISNHIIPMKLLKNEFIKSDNKEVKSLSGRNLTLYVKNGSLSVDNAHVISIEPAGYDGVIYLIDKVLN